ncbi:MAG: 30S ribosomal protein S9 [Patescibacteria group bacterium]|nr:30S ribosomal protein S9 [Patescibacteria group bacterium]
MVKKAKKTQKSSNKKSRSKKGSKKRTYIFAVGRRKSAVARVRYYKKGKNEIIINQKDYKEHFVNLEFKNIIEKPLKVTGNLKKFGKFTIKVKGGGKRGQVEAISLGMSRILVTLEPKNRKLLKPEGLLKRDPRVKERKKYGLKRARRAPQWRKR